MKYLSLLILGLTLLGCSQTNHTIAITEKQKENLKSPESYQSKDEEEIQNLIRAVLNWSDSNSKIDLLPVLTDSKDSTCIGFDFNKHNSNLAELKSTNLFADEFIQNYNQIILTLDRKIKNKEFDKWNTYELPTFSFASDANPWCLCQDVPYDNPNPWDLVETDIINLQNDKGELVWRWGKLELNSDPGWKEFAYRFRVEKVNNKWKIAYLQGFDFKESTQ